MSTVLVVDDSPVDRRVACGLLEAESDWSVLSAADGDEALRQLRHQEVDVVVTDLLMAPMNGLGLVKKVAQQFPLVPVILMTSMGNDSIAVQALRQGAASYVAKKRLSEELCRTVRHVMTGAIANRGGVNAQNLIARSNHLYLLDNDLNQINALIEHLQQAVTRRTPVDQARCLQTTLAMNEAERLRVNMALYEALLNAYFHGNLELGPETRKQDRAALAEQRRHQPPYSTRQIRVETTFTPSEATYVIEDEGPGFNPQQFWTNETDSLDEQLGRGLVLMRTIMDQVHFNERGNQVTLIKQRESVDQ